MILEIIFIIVIFIVIFLFYIDSRQKNIENFSITKKIEGYNFSWKDTFKYYIVRYKYLNENVIYEHLIKNNQYFVKGENFQFQLKGYEENMRPSKILEIQI